MEAPRGRLLAGGLVAAVLVAALWARASAQAAPPRGCTTAVVSLAPCLSYVTGNASAPSSACCTQLAGVVQSQVRCLCAVLNNGAAAPFGIPLNQTQALSLPGACGIRTPPLGQCNAAAATPPTPTSPAAPAPTSPPTTSPAAPVPTSPATPSPAAPTPTSPATPSTPPSLPSDGPPPSRPSSTSPSTPSVPGGGVPSENGSKEVPTGGRQISGSSTRLTTTHPLFFFFLTVTSYAPAALLSF